MNRLIMIGFLGLAMLGLAGCAGPSFGPKAANGIVFYCPGAGNLDLGDAGLRDGLGSAGFKGEVARFDWTISLNPAIDQAVRINARLRASTLAKYIQAYKDQYPNGKVCLVGLSAGTGVAIWALEDLDPRYSVDSVVLLGSSLSYNYDVSKALPRVKGKIYNYYSSNDAVLAGPMKVFGTIDGVFFVDGAGAVGLRPAIKSPQIVNIPWKAEYERYGYAGGHTDSTSPAFIRAVVARNILSSPASQAPEIAPATPPAAVVRAAHPN